MILYHCPPSGNGYKVRLFEALSGLSLPVHAVDQVAVEVLPGYVKADAG